MNSEHGKSDDGDKVEGRYTNFFKIGYNAFEFLIDFYQSYPESEKVQHHTRIITNPVYARALLDTLCESIQKYEQTFNKITTEDK